MLTLSEAASILSALSARTNTGERHPIIDGIRRPTFSEVQRGLPAHFWVKDIVRPNGRKDKKFFSPEGVSFRSMKQAAESLKF